MIDDPPAFLQGDALEKWRELAPLALPGWSPDMLAAYCAAYGRWVAAERWLADPAPQHGPIITIRDDKGNVKSHGSAPQLSIAERSAREMTRLGGLLQLDRALAAARRKGRT